MMTWFDTKKGVSQSRTQSSLHNTYKIVYVLILLTNTRIFGVMYAHAHAMYTRPPFPKKCGLESRLRAYKLHAAFIRGTYYDLLPSQYTCTIVLSRKTPKGRTTVRPRFKATLQICDILELQQFSDL